MSAKDSSARPGFCLTVDERTPALLVASGTTPRLQRFEPGTQVLFPFEPQAGLDARAAVNTAVDASGLAERARSAARVTLLVSDALLPQPAMRSDVRALLLEVALDRLAAARVDDVQIVVTSTMGRIVPPESIERIVGERVWRSFAVLQAITSHDAEADDLVTVGEAAGVPVQLNRRVAESDLVVDLRVLSEQPWASDEPAGGWVDVAIGAAGTATVQGIRGARAIPGAARAIADVLAAHVPMLAVTAVLGQPRFRAPLGFLSEREWEWKPADRLAYRAVRRLLATAADPTARRLYRQMGADYSVVGVFGGEPDEVARLASDCLLASQGVQPERPADLLALGSPHPNPAANGSISNPVSGAWAALGRGGLAADPALLRDGGSLVVFHPLAPRFSTRLHHATSDFWSQALADGASLDAVASHEQRLREDPWLLELYRHRHGFHPLQPFHLWYACQPAITRAGEVIYVGAQRDDAARLGGRAASTWADALEIARANVGADPAVTYVRNTGPLMVRGER